MGSKQTLEQIALSTADGAACDLGVSREELVLALADDSDLDTLARTHGISKSDAEDAVRQGLLRGVRDAENAGAIGSSTARTLCFAADFLPMRVVLTLLRGPPRRCPADLAAPTDEAAGGLRAYVFST